MSVSVQELDNTVRAFFEGKGDVVRILSPRCRFASRDGRLVAHPKLTNNTQQKQAQQTLTEVSSPPSSPSQFPHLRRRDK
jgi:exportin-1